LKNLPVGKEGRGGTEFVTASGRITELRYRIMQVVMDKK
jgi:hypothetical protein